LYSRHEIPNADVYDEFECSQFNDVSHTASATQFPGSHDRHAK